MKSLILLALLIPAFAFADDAKPAAPAKPPTVPSDCSKIAVAGDTQETTIFECIRKAKGDTVYCLIVKSGYANGTPAVSTSCIKL